MSETMIFLLILGGSERTTPNGIYPNGIIDLNFDEVTFRAWFGSEILVCPRIGIIP